MRAVLITYFCGLALAVGVGLAVGHGPTVFAAAVAPPSAAPSDPVVYDRPCPWKPFPGDGACEIAI